MTQEYKYELNYDFEEFNEIIETYLTIITDSSEQNFKRQYYNNEISDLNSEIDALFGFIRNLEEFLYYNYCNDPENFDQVLTSIINKVKIIGVLPKGKRGIFGETETEKKLISINPKLEASSTLDEKERTRLYMAHELGHVINDEWMKDVLNFVNNQLRQGNLSREQAELIYDGFSMLDETTAQNRAENFAYSLAEKSRPNLKYYQNRLLFGGDYYRTNFDWYGELQQPATMFARTLRGIGSIENDTLALDTLSHRATYSNFARNIIEEYIRDGQYPSFLQEFQCMGILRRASYANFGAESPIYLQKSQSYLIKLRTLTSQMRDYRNPTTYDSRY